MARGKKPAVSPYERKRWLEDFEKGKGIKGIRHPDAKMARTVRWKLNYYASGEGELYDLHNDPDEEENLFRDPERAPVVREMKDRILEWLMTADETDQIAPRWRVGSPLVEEK